MRRYIMSRAKLIAVLAITSLLVVLGILNLRDRLSAKAIADDGIEWVDTGAGVQAKSVSAESPLAFSIRKGDYVRFVFYHDKYEKIERAETIALYLDKIGIGSDGRYVIEHPDTALQNIYRLEEPIYDVDFKVVARPPKLGRGLYLAFIGLVYLGIGLFVLFKQNRAALTYHFYAWCLLSFVAYFYSATFEFTFHDRL